MCAKERMRTRLIPGVHGLVQDHISTSPNPTLMYNLYLGALLMFCLSACVAPPPPHLCTSSNHWTLFLPACNFTVSSPVSAPMFGKSSVAFFSVPNNYNYAYSSRKDCALSYNYLRHGNNTFTLHIPPDRPRSHSLSSAVYRVSVALPPCL